MEGPYAWYQTQEYYIEVGQSSIQQPKKKLSGMQSYSKREKICNLIKYDLL